MRIFFFIIIILILPSCATIEVAKGVTKATSSIKNSVNNLINSNEDNKKREIERENNIINSIQKDKEIVEKEKKKEKEITLEQKKIVEINFFKKNISDILLLIGKPNLSRVDGNTHTLRFDSDTCRLFLFSNSNDKIQKIKHYELRDTNGDLIIKKNKIQNCYKDFELS